jgi:AmmeMemoRadiSam system protein B
VPAILPALRLDLDIMPSPVSDRPGVLIRDSRRYSDATLIVPPLLAHCLQYFDGQHTELDLHEILVRITGDLRAGELATHLIETLSNAGFLRDEIYERMREARHREFADRETRLPVHAGSGYPDEMEELRKTMLGYLDGEAATLTAEHLIGIAAPHVSPFGGWQSYRAAYRALPGSHRERTFIVLGTSHYGEPDRFGLTRKPFDTPYGQARTDISLVNQLAGEAGDGAQMEDYCHSVEHSIEFQVVFLQHLFGPDVNIVPILCGSFANSVYKGGMPEDNERVRRFIGALGNLAARENGRLCWVLGIDMAHMGRRYGDQFTAIADRGEMLEVAERDRQRLERVNAGDACGFWELVRENQDDLKWCGSSPIYTFLTAVPEARGQILRYEQWNIDEQSVVTFAGAAFTAAT